MHSTRGMVLTFTTLHAGIPSPPPFDPKRNGLLASLPERDYARLLPHLKAVDMPLGQVLHGPGEAMSHVVFPVTAIVSILYVTENGSSAEIALVGNEGLVGIVAFMGGDTTPSRSVVQSAGIGYRLPAHALKAAFDGGGAVQQLLLRYTQALMTQMSQTAACNRHHTIHQQLCRWLLLSLDRLGVPDLLMTQERIAHMLGVRREGVTAEAGRLQTERIIRYDRGRITVLDRAKLERSSCECYAVVKKEYDRLLPAAVAI